MDPSEVIIVEDDSPPSSPAPDRMPDNNSNNIDLSSTNDTLSWAQFTAKFISMNSVGLANDKLVSDNGYRTTMNVAASYNGGNAMTNNYNNIQVANNNLQRQYQSQYSQYKPVNSQFTSYNYYPETPPYYHFMHSFEVMKNYPYYPSNKNNATLPVDMNQTKTNNYYYYNGPSPPQTPLNFETNNPEFKEYPEITISAVSSNKDTAVQLQPEFVDVNAYVNYNTNIDIPPPSNVRLIANNQPSVRDATKEKRKTTNTTTAFLNDRRTVSITKMLNSEQSKDIVSSTIQNVTNNDAADSDDSDIIFIGEYKNADKKPEIVLSSNCGEQNSINVNKCEIKLETNCPKIGLPEGTDQNTKKTSPAPRRNPKRQVQCAKKAVRSVNEILLTSKNKFRAKKPNNKVNNKKSATADKNLRRSLRTKLNCGAVYCPPSPIGIKHLRDWPAEGMHERPEYNPVTNTIEPFDSYIRNISHQNKSPPTKPNGISNTSPEDLEENHTLAQLCHDMLHHVLAYVATVKVMQDQEDERKMLHETDNHSKMNFLTNLALEKTDNFDERIWQVLTDTVKHINSPKRTDSKFTELRDLIENSILLYCFTNNVSRSNVSKYIANINPADVMQLSNEKFGLSLDAQ